MSRHRIGDEGVLARSLKARCGCGYVAPVGSRIKLLKRVSDQPGNSREVLAEIDAKGFVTLHKVRVSSVWLKGEGEFNV